MPQLDRIAPIEKAFNPSLNQNFPPSRGLYVGVSGDITVTLVSGQAITLVGLAAGIIHPIRIIQVSSAGLTAQNIVVMS